MTITFDSITLVCSWWRHRPFQSFGWRWQPAVWQQRPRQWSTRTWPISKYFKTEQFLCIWPQNISRFFKKVLSGNHTIQMRHIVYSSSPKQVNLKLNWTTYEFHFRGFWVDLLFDWNWWFLWRSRSYLYMPSSTWWIFPSPSFHNVKVVLPVYFSLTRVWFRTTLISDFQANSPLPIHF